MVLQASNHHSRGRHISGPTPSTPSKRSSKTLSVVQAAKKRAATAVKKPLKRTVNTRQTAVAVTPPVLNTEMSIFSLPPTQDRDVEMGKTTKVALPKQLGRPMYTPIKAEALAAVEIDKTPLEYVWEVLEYTGLDMLHLLSTVRTSRPFPHSMSSLPKEIEIHLGEITPNPPTHMLAVFTRSSPATASSSLPSKKIVTLYPTHNIVLATHCSSLPPLPSPSHDASTQTIIVPVIPLGLPAPHAFPALHAFLYTKNPAYLYSFLLPAITISSPTPVTMASLVEEVGRMTPNVLLKHLWLVNGVWRNVCALGVFDKRLWNIIDASWALLLEGLSKATCA